MHSLGIDITRTREVSKHLRPIVVFILCKVKNTLIYILSVSKLDILKRNIVLDKNSFYSSSTRVILEINDSIV